MVGDVREIKYAIRTAANFAAFCALRGSRDCLLGLTVTFCAKITDGWIAAIGLATRCQRGEEKKSRGHRSQFTPVRGAARKLEAASRSGTSGQWRAGARDSAGRATRLSEEDANASRPRFVIAVHRGGHLSSEKPACLDGVIVELSRKSTLSRIEELGARIS